MKTLSPKKKRIYIGLMLFGGAALFCDRFLLSGTTAPELAAAEEMTDVHAADPSAAPLSIPELPFPKGVGDIPKPDVLRDLFADPSRDSGTRSSPDKTSEGQRSTPDAGTGADFLAKHALQGVLIQESGQFAVINKKLVRADELIGGCKVLAIHQREVRILCEDGEVILKMARPVPASQH